MSQYFKENGSTCETSPTALFVFKDSGDFKDGAEVPAEWQRSELVAEVKDIREINLTPPAITTELFIPPTRQSDSQKKSGPMFKSHYCNKQKYTVIKIEPTMHFPNERRSFLPKKQRRPSVKQDNLFLFPITGCFSFLLRVLTARPKIWNIELNVIQKRMN